jgi:RNA polymerase sigma-70 factor (ECF subfamily)
MEGPRQPTPAELACDLPLLASSSEAREAEVEIEQEVMTLFEQYRDPLLRYAVSFGVPVPDAEEIVQEVFLSLFRHLQLGRSRQNLRGWIFRVAHNLTLKRRHANQRMPAVTEEQADIAARRPDPRPNPEDACSEAHRQKRLLAVVLALSDVDQSCLRMRAEGLRYREIAGALGISLGSVSMSLARSLGKLIRADWR